MQAWVIDSNMLQSAELRRYLRASVGNLAVLPDFAWYEIYKQETLDGLRHGLSVVGDHPDQTILLRPGGDIARLNPAVAEDLGRLILDGPIGDIRELVSMVRSDAPWEADAQAQLNALWAWARTTKPSLIEGAIEFVQSFPEMQEQMFHGTEIRIIRTGSKYTERMIVTIFGAAVQIWETLAKEYELPWDGLSEEEISRAYLFRFGLGLIMYLLWWVRLHSTCMGCGSMHRRSGVRSPRFSLMNSTDRPCRTNAAATSNSKTVESTLSLPADDDMARSLPAEQRKIWVKMCKFNEISLNFAE